MVSTFVLVGNFENILRAVLLTGRTVLARWLYVSAANAANTLVFVRVVVEATVDRWRRVAAQREVILEEVNVLRTDIRCVQILQIARALAVGLHHLGRDGNIGRKSRHVTVSHFSVATQVFVEQRLHGVGAFVGWRLRTFR